jgi:hypothetical protein
MSEHYLSGFFNLNCSVSHYRYLKTLVYVLSVLMELRNANKANAYKLGKKCELIIISCLMLFYLV